MKFFLVSILSLTYTCTVHAQLLDITGSSSSAERTIEVYNLPPLTQTSGQFHDPPFYEIFVSLGDGTTVYDKIESYGGSNYSFPSFSYTHTYSSPGCYSPMISIMDRKDDPDPPAITHLLNDPREVCLGPGLLFGTKSYTNNIDILDCPRIKLETSHRFVKPGRILEVTISFVPEEEGKVILLFSSSKFEGGPRHQCLTYNTYTQDKIRVYPIQIGPFDTGVEYEITAAVLDEYWKTGEQPKLKYYLQAQEVNVDSFALLALLFQREEDSLNGNRLCNYKRDSSFLKNILNGQNNVLGNTIDQNKSEYIDADTIGVDVGEPIDPNTLILLKNEIKSCDRILTVPFEFNFENIGDGESNGSYVFLNQLLPTEPFYNIKPVYVKDAQCRADAFCGTEVIDRNCKGGCIKRNEDDRLKGYKVYCCPDLRLSSEEYATFRFTADIDKSVFLQSYVDGQSFFEACQLFANARPPHDVAVCTRDVVKCRKPEKDSIRGDGTHRENCRDQLFIVSGNNCPGVFERLWTSIMRWFRNLFG